MEKLSTRQIQIAERIAKGMPDKGIAHDMGLSIHTVRAHIRAAAENVPGPTSPRHRLTLFFIELEAEALGEGEPSPTQRKRGGQAHPTPLDAQGSAVALNHAQELSR